MRYLKNLVNKPGLVCWVAWYCALFVVSYSVWVYMSIVSDLNTSISLVNKIKKCSVYQMGEQTVKVCPSNSSKK
jgi:hypothetical protein